MPMDYYHSIVIASSLKWCIRHQASSSRMLKFIFSPQTSKYQSNEMMISVAAAASAVTSFCVVAVRPSHHQLTQESWIPLTII